MSASPLTERDIIFPSASTSINDTLRSLKRSNLSISNRLHSIASDARFVLSVAGTFRLPLVANERCGSWYIPLDRKVGSVYFKSTDGHHGQWSFSLRRLNLQVLDLIGREEGCIIVDSTRRGKSMPDALSKTVPIWITVLNRLLFPNHAIAGELQTPQDVISASEHAQIAARIDGFVNEARSLDLDLASLRSKLAKPMRPVWVTPSADLGDIEPPWVDDEFATVALCTASSRSSAVEHDASYVQGAADDHEAWACGLSAVTFWLNCDTLLETSEDDLPGTIAEILDAKQRVGAQDRVATLIRPTLSLWVAGSSAVDRAAETYDAIVDCSPSSDEARRRELVKAGTMLLHLPCSTGKNGSRQLRAQLHQLERLQALDKEHPKILVTCVTGKDIAIGAALAVICMYCSAGGGLDTRVRQSAPSKVEIKRKLSWIMVSMPDVAPSRATLQSVNAFLMG